VAVDQLLPSSPVERAKRPRNPVRERGGIWTPGQLRAFLDTARGHRLFAFFHLAACTGARRGELLNLRWRDVDLAAAEIRITGSAAVVGGQRIEGTTKSGRSRTVSIDAGTVQVLREHYARQVADHETVGPEWRGGGYVFATGWGDPVHPDTVSSLVADLIRAHNSLVAGDDPDGLAGFYQRGPVRDVLHNFNADGFESLYPLRGRAPAGVHAGPAARHQEDRQVQAGRARAAVFPVEPGQAR
jgi:hypothetical protein